MHGASDLVDVGGVEAGHGDAAVGGEVDGVVAEHGGALGLGEAGEGEHADLAGDVVPVAGRAGAAEGGDEGGAHVADAAGHAAHVGGPVGGELGARKDGAREARAPRGRAAVHRAHDRLDLALDARGLVGARAEHVQRADALAVHAEVLGERLAQQHRARARARKEPQRVRVALGVARRKALVRRVEHDRVPALQARRADALPLGRRRVRARRVVRARVEQKDRARRRRPHVRQQPLDVHAARPRVKVPVRLHPQARVPEHRVVVAPRRRRQVHRRRHPARRRPGRVVPPPQELARQPQRPRPGQRLHRRNVLVVVVVPVLPKCHHPRSNIERFQSPNLLLSRSIICRVRLKGENKS